MKLTHLSCRRPALANEVSRGVRSASRSLAIRPRKSRTARAAALDRRHASQDDAPMRLHHGPFRWWNPALLKPGLYVRPVCRMTATLRPPTPAPAPDYVTRARNWFVVSDMGLTALNGAVACSLRALARRRQKARRDRGPSARRNNEVLVTGKPTRTAMCARSGLARGTGALRPHCWSRPKSPAIMDFWI